MVDGIDARESVGGGVAGYPGSLAPPGASGNRAVGTAARALVAPGYGRR
jgi:hypothetical protein